MLVLAKSVCMSIFITIEQCEQVLKKTYRWGEKEKKPKLTIVNIFILHTIRNITQTVIIICKTTEKIGKLKCGRGE